jgi:DNA-binding HxlR family transcriptional regulator/peroxiredoxin
MPMPWRNGVPDEDCAVAHALGVVGDGWSMLIVRDLARGIDRFDALVDSLSISRKVLTERLRDLSEQGVLVREPYQHGPTRHRYRLSAKGRALLPVVIALQDWGDRWVLGDGSLTATAEPDGSEAHRMHSLAGQQLPDVPLPSTAGLLADLVADRPTVLFGFPAATVIPGSLPEGWGQIPGAAGCTLENRLFHQRRKDFAAAGVVVHGVSTQRPDEQRAFAAAEGITHPLFSDANLDLTAALRLPTFRAADTERLKRVVLIVDAERVIRSVRYPVTDIPATIDWALDTARRAS